MYARYEPYASIIIMKLKQKSLFLANESEGENVWEKGSHVCEKVYTV